MLEYFNGDIKSSMTLIMITTVTSN